MKFLPDAAATTPDVLTDVGMVPTPRGYAAPPGLVSTGFDALAAECTGAALLRKLDGVTRLIAGTTANLYEGSGSTWSSVSRVGGYTTGAIRWSFAQFGNTSLAINKATVLQQSSSGAFADVANSPKAACMDTVGGFVMLGNTDDTGGLGLYGDQPHRWWCSQLFSATSTWAPSVSTQANSGLLVSSPGGIVCVKRLGDQAVYYKARAIHVGTYVGPPEVWRFDLVPGEVGAVSQEAVISIGTAHYFIGFEDIYRFDGGRPVAIGAGIREWFYGRLSKSNDYIICGLHDYDNGRVLWFYPSGGGSTLDSVLVYNYVTDTWGHYSQTITIPVSFKTSGITYDDLGNLYATYDDLPNIAYDSPFWIGGSPVPAVFGSDELLYTMTGTSGSSYMVTGYFGDPERISMCDRVRIRYRTKPTTETVIPYSVMELGDTPTAGTATHNDDRHDLRVSGRWHKFRVDFTGAVEVEALAPRLKPKGFE